MPLPSPLSVHHFNGMTKGGAAIAARRIAKAVRNTGVETHFWHSHSAAPISEFPGGVLDYPKPHRWIHQWRYKRHCAEYWAAIKGTETAHFTSPWSFDRPTLPPQQFGKSILHLHWIGKNILDYKAFFNSIPNTQPIIWTLHDLNPLTGGCHYAGECRGFTQSCGNCPQISRPKPNDLTHKAMKLKLRVLEGKNLHLVANSHWTEAQIRASSVGRLAKSIRMIHYPLDTQAFSPCDPLEARSALEIPPSPPVIAFGAQSLDDKLKGTSHLVEALLRIKDQVKFQLVIFGNAVPEALVNSGIPFTHVGFIADISKQRLLYASANLFAFPSVEESCGQVGIEALACGTPVVGFRTGGIPDFVIHGETGFLAKTGDSSELGACIKDALNHPTRLQTMRAAARTMAVNLFEEKQQGRRYRELYEEISAEQKS